MSAPRSPVPDRPSRRATLQRLCGIVLLTLLSVPAARAGDRRVAPFTLPALDGGRVDVGEFIGRDVVVLAFWATWCSCCLEELPKLEVLTKSRPDLTIVTINIDPPAQHTRAAAQMRRLRFDSLSLVDPEGRVVDIYNKQKKTPTLVLVDRRGVLRKTFTGYSPSEAEALTAEIDALLGETDDKR